MVCWELWMDGRRRSFVFLLTSSYSRPYPMCLSFTHFCGMNHRSCYTPKLPWTTMLKLLKLSGEFGWGQMLSLCRNKILWSGLGFIHWFNCSALAVTWNLIVFLMVRYLCFCPREHPREHSSWKYGLKCICLFCLWIQYRGWFMNGSKKHRRLWKVPFAWTRVMGKVNGKGTMLPDQGFLGKEVDIFLDVWRWKWNTSTQRRFLWWFLEVSGTIYSSSHHDDWWNIHAYFPFSIFPNHSKRRKQKWSYKKKGLCSRSHNSACYASNLPSLYQPRNTNLPESQYQLPPCIITETVRHSRLLVVF